MAQSFVFSLFTISGALDTELTGVNNLGVLSGFDVTAAGPKGFTDDGGSITTVSVDPSAIGVQVHGINDNGAVVGTNTYRNGPVEGFILENGSLATVSDPNAGDGTYQGTYLNAINDAGSAAGWYVDGHNLTHGFTDIAGVFATVDDLAGAEGTWVEGINFLGTLAGWYFDSLGIAHGFVESGGSFTTIDDPEGVDGTFVEGLNDLGQLVGVYDDAKENQHGFIYENGGFTTVDAPGAVHTTELTGINDEGTITGFADNVSYAQFGFTTSIPEAPACFVAGTQIRTARGDVAVEFLQIGDLIQTWRAGLQPVKWIGQRTYGSGALAGNRQALPVCVKASTLARGIPAFDLWLSPGHALCLNGGLVRAGDLVDQRCVVQPARAGDVSYFHVELAQHEVVFAESCPVESFMDEAFRRQFRNVAEYGALYPGERAARHACLARLEGFALLAAQRGGLAAAGSLVGYIDVLTPYFCCGWAYGAHGVDPVCLDVLQDGRRVGRVLANRYRGDVGASMRSSGYHGFEFASRRRMTGVLEVRRASDGAVLPLAVQAPTLAAA